MRERLLFGLAVCGLLVAGAVAAANIDLVDAEQVSAAVDAPDQALPVAQVADTAPRVVDDAPCKYPDKCEPVEPATVTLFIDLELSGMLAGGEVFDFSWTCSGGVSGDRGITQEELFAGGGEARIVAATTVLASGSCEVTMTSAPPGWSNPGGVVLDANGTDIVASFFTTDAG